MNSFIPVSRPTIAPYCPLALSVAVGNGRKRRWITGGMRSERPCLACPFPLGCFVALEKTIWQPAIVELGFANSLTFTPPKPRLTKAVPV
jgi:hypothetical protein